MAYIDREGLVKNLQSRGVEIRKDSLDYSVITWTSKAFRFATVDEAMRSVEFTDRMKKSFRYMADLGDALLPGSIADGLKEIILEYPKIIVGPERVISNLDIVNAFKDLGEIKLPFPAMTFTQIQDDRTVGLGITHVFIRQDHEQAVNLLIMLGTERAIENPKDLTVYFPLQLRIEIINNALKVGLATHLKDACVPSTELLDEVILNCLYCIYKTTVNDSGESYYVSKPTPREVQVNRKKLNKKRVPIIEFRLVKIEPIKPKLPTLPQGTHASPRQHWRRGHWRNCKSGKRVFISPMLVGDPNNGKIIKDYIVGESTHAH